MERNDYTVRVFKADRRVKAGERLVIVQDHTNTDRNTVAHLYKTTWAVRDGYRIEILETYCMVRNAMTGAMVQERFDTAYTCSVASETYWSS